MQPLTVEGQSRPTWRAFLQAIRLGKSTRLLLRYGRTFRPLLWLKVSPDGSIVVGFHKRPREIVRTSHRRDPALPLRSGKLREESIEPGRTDFHFSFHSSGVINAGGQRSYRMPFKASDVHQLCLISFEDPGYLPPVAPRRWDVVLPSVLDERWSLQARLSIPPADTTIFFEDVEVQTAVLLPAVKHGHAATVLQFSLFERLSDWPEHTLVQLVSQDPEVHGFQGPRS